MEYSKFLQGQTLFGIPILDPAPQSPLAFQPSDFFDCGILRGGGSKEEGYLRHLESLGNTMESWGVLSFLPPPYGSKYPNMKYVHNYAS